MFARKLVVEFNTIGGCIILCFVTQLFEIFLTLLVGIRSYNW